MSSGSQPSVYPPPNHILSALGIDYRWRDDEVLLGRVATSPELLAGTPGAAIGVGSLTPIVDVIGGSCVSRHLDGDWMATADVWLHERRPITGGPLELEARILRAGRRSMVALVEVLAGGTPSVTSTIEFSRIRGEASGHRAPPLPPDGRWRRMGHGPLLDRPVGQACGVRVIEAGAGVVEVGRSDFVANSIGTLQGGVVALLADVAASAVVGPEARTVDLQFRFLDQTGVGPARTSTETIRTDAAGTVVRVDVADVDAGSLVGSAVCRVAH